MKAKTKDEWVAAAYKKHKGKYDYSTSVYVNNKTKLCINCGVHGPFWQEPNAHIKGQGCPLCAVVGGKSNTEEFIQRSKVVHNNKYDYSYTVYTYSKQKVEIVCPVHGLFVQSAGDHLSGRGCIRCGFESTKNSKTTDYAEAMRRAYEVHADTYDYSLVQYEKLTTPVQIICKTHGAFTKTLDRHINNREGCPKCNSHEGGFNGDKPVILYYLRVTVAGMPPLYKIGITNNTVQERYCARDLAKILVLSEVKHAVGSNTRAEESEILKRYKEFKYAGQDVLHSGGNTELFTKDVLNLDKDENE